MKKFIFTIALALFTSAIAQAQDHHSDHPSVHGMLMVGQSKIYLSHLPMFHSPHDYQVIVEAHLSENGLKAYLENLFSSEETVYTLVPEAFVLPEMIANPKPFKAQIYQGHFERGGKLIASNVLVEIEKVIYFKKFSGDEAKPASATYLLFGNQEEQFLAHLITAKPDFDHVLKVKKQSVVPQTLQGKDVVHVSFPSLSNLEPVSDDKVLSAEIASAGASGIFSIEIQKDIYLEFGDLSH